MKIHRTPTPMPPAIPAIDFRETDAGRARPDLAVALNRLAARTHAVPYGVEQAEARAHEWQPLLTLNIGAVVSHLVVAEARAETITEKTRLGALMSPTDFQRLFGAMACAIRVADALVSAAKAAHIIGLDGAADLVARKAAIAAVAGDDEKQILVEQERASVRVLLEGNERLSISGRVVDGESE